MKINTKMRLEMFFGKIWLIPSCFTGGFRTDSGQILSKFRTNWESFWTKSEHILSKFRTDSGQNQDRFWTNSGQILDRFFAS